jgi:hypothetical protein
VPRVVNRRLHIRRKFFLLGAIPGVENQKEFAQSTEGGLVKGLVFGEWSLEGKGFLGEGWHWGLLSEWEYGVLGGASWRR